MSQTLQPASPPLSEPLQATSLALEPGSSHSLRRFLVIAVGGGLLLQVPALFEPAFMGLALVVMWIPTLGVLLAGPHARALARRMLARPIPWRMLLVASFLGWFHKVVSGLLSLGWGMAKLDGAHFAVAGGRVVHADFIWGFPSGGEPVALFLLHLMLVQLVGVVIVGGLMTFGEELGWRGFLQPHLERRFGTMKGTFLVGLIWAYWHLGFMLAGHNDGGAHPAVNALVFFPLEVVAVSFLYAWLTRLTGSVWPAVCAHAANNSFPSSKMLEVTSWWGDKAAGLVTTALLALLVWGLFRLRSARSPRYEGVLQSL